MKRHHGGLTASDPSLLVLVLPSCHTNGWRCPMYQHHRGSCGAATLPLFVGCSIWARVLWKLRRHGSSDQIRFPWRIVLRFVAFSVDPIDSGVDLAMYARNHLPGAHSHVCSLLYFPLQPADAFSGHGL